MLPLLYENVASALFGDMGGDTGRGRGLLAGDLFFCLGEVGGRSFGRGGTVFPVADVGRGADTGEVILLGFISEEVSVVAGEISVLHEVPVGIDCTGGMASTCTAVEAGAKKVLWACWLANITLI